VYVEAVYGQTTDKSQVTFIYIALMKIQIVSELLYSDKQERMTQEMQTKFNSDVKCFMLIQFSSITV